MTDSILNLTDDTQMLGVVRAGLARADDVCIAVSFTRCSGLGLLVDPLREVAGRGGRVRILTSTYQSVTQPEALESLRRLPRVETRVQNGPVGFHSKFWWFRGTSGGGRFVEVAREQIGGAVVAEGIDHGDAAGQEGAGALR